MTSPQSSEFSPNFLRLRQKLTQLDADGNKSRLAQKRLLKQFPELSEGSQFLLQYQ